MVEFVCYEENENRRIVGYCEVCGSIIYSDTDHYLIEKDRVCENCINEYVTNNFYIYGEEWYHEVYKSLLPWISL